MSDLILREWQGKTVRQREDGYISLTDMAQATEKKINDWTRQKSTTEYFEALSADAGIPVTELLQVFQGGFPDRQGTWGHRLLALEFARWCSPAFAIQCNKWVEELLLNGAVACDDVSQQQLIGLLQRHPHSKHLAQAIEFAVQGHTVAVQDELWIENEYRERKLKELEEYVAALEIRQRFPGAMSYVKRPKWLKDYRMQ